MSTILDAEQRAEVQTANVPNTVAAVPRRPMRPGPDALDFTLRINGIEHRLTLDPRTTLLDALREHLGPDRHQEGLRPGQCGACTVLVDGRRINACLTLAVMQQGKEITTIEGLARRRRAAPAAGGVHRARRLPVRLLHAGPDHVGGRPARRGARAFGRRDPRVDERQHLPLRRLPKIVAAIQQVGRGRRSVSVAALRLRPRRNAGAAIDGAGADGAAIHRRRHRPDPTDEGGRRAPRRSGRHQRPAAAPRSRLGARGLRIGALARMSDVADHPAVRERFPVIAQALLASASPQVRNMATIGGNLLQRTRCPYFRDRAMPCNKRAPGTGCARWRAINRLHAILGGSEHASPPTLGRLAVALVALDAVVLVEGRSGERRDPDRRVPPLPGDTPSATRLEPGELIIAVEVPAERRGARSHYLKIRDRRRTSSRWSRSRRRWTVDGGAIPEARVAPAGSAPSRGASAEADVLAAPGDRPRLPGGRPSGRGGRSPLAHNAFKVELLRARRCGARWPRAEKRHERRWRRAATAASTAGQGHRRGQYAAEPRPGSGATARRRRARSPRAGSPRSTRAAAERGAGRAGGDHPRERAQAATGRHRPFRRPAIGLAAAVCRTTTCATHGQPSRSWSPRPSSRRPRGRPGPHRLRRGAGDTDSRRRARPGAA